MRRRAFTIMEVMLAVGLLVMLSASLAAFLDAFASRRRALSLSASDAYAATAMLDRIEIDALTAIAGGGGGGAGGGVVGSADRVRLLSRGVWLGSAPGERGGGDLQGCEFAFDAGSGRLTGQRWGGPSPAGQAEVLSEHVAEFRVRYHDGRAWRDDFDSTRAGFLPVAIEVSIWFGEPMPAEPGVPPDDVDPPSEAPTDEPPGRLAATPALEEAPFDARPVDDARPSRQRPPDRQRTIAIPDAGPPESSGSPRGSTP